MSDDRNPSEHASRIGRVTEEIRRIVAEGGAVDARALARQFAISWTDVERCARAVRALDAAAPPGAEDTEPPASDADAALPPPSLPPDYELLGELGRGGMAVVYRARQRSLGRVVAVKVLRPGDLVFGAMQKRFLLEARALARLRHPHIVAVHEVGEAGANVFFSMDLVEGQSLADVVRSGGMTPTRAVKLLRQVASAIAYSHANGLVHRDLKPGNILVDRAGDAFVVDFGLARDLGSKGDMTGTGQLLGTPAYMSPEQARGDTARIGEPADIYALGAVLYECLTGRPPFHGDSVIDTVRAVVQDEPVPPRKVDPKIPPDLEIICLKAMAKEPERRYANAQAFLEDLERFAEGRGIRARPPSRVYRLRKWARRHRTPLVATAVTAAVGAAALWIALAATRVVPERTRLDDARDCFERGEFEQAAALSDDAVRRYGEKGDLWAENASVDEETVAMEFVVLAARSHAAVLHRWYDEGRVAEVAKEVPAVYRAANERRNTQFGKLGRGMTLHGFADVARDLVWLGARANARLGNLNGVRDALSETRNLCDFHLGVPHDDGTWTYEPRFDFARVAPFFDAAGAAIAGADEGERSAAFLLVGESLATPRLDQGVHGWLATRPDGGLSLAADVVRRLPRWAAGDAAPDVPPADVRIVAALAPLFEEAAASRPRDVVGALVAVASDTEAAPVSRSAAAEILRVVDDLPLAAAPGGPTQDASRVARILALHAEVTALAPADALRRRVDVAFDEDASPDWIARHTGLSGPDLPVRWSEIRASDPRTWFLFALDLPATTTRADVLRALLTGSDEPGSLRRSWLHELLRLDAPSATAGPAWGHGLAGPGGIGTREPKGLARAWCDALPADAPPDRFRVRVAVLAFHEGREDPDVVRQASLPIRTGERRTVTLPWTLGGPPIRTAGETTHWFHFPWPDGEPFDWSPGYGGDFRHELTVSLDYRPQGLVFSWTPDRYVDWYISRACWTSFHTEKLEVDTGPVLARGSRVAMYRPQRGTASDVRAIRVLTVAAYEPESADAAPWAWTQWKAALTAGGLGDRILPLPPRGDGAWVALGLGLTTLLAGAGAFLAWRAVRPGVGRPRRWRAAAALVVAGLALAANHAEVAGTDLRVEVAGWALLVLGSAVLAFAATGGRRLVAAAAPVVLTHGALLCLLSGSAGMAFLLTIGLPSLLWAAAAIGGLRWPRQGLAFLAMWPVGIAALGIDSNARWMPVLLLAWLALVVTWLVVAVRRRAHAVEAEVVAPAPVA